jgi:stage III sporulation protein AG
MDQQSILSKGKAFLQKYRYALLVVLLGLGLMLLPGRDQPETVPQQEKAIQRVSLSEEMEQILSSIQDAGRVKVLLTLEKGEETVYQTDEDRDGESLRLDTVLITDADRNQQGLIRQVNPEKYLGAVILCQGADSAAVRLAIVEAVAKLTGLGTDRISVLKMK